MEQLIEQLRVLNRLLALLIHTINEQDEGCEPPHEPERIDMAKAIVKALSEDI